MRLVRTDSEFHNQSEHHVDYRGGIQMKTVSEKSATKLWTEKYYFETVKEDWSVYKLADGSTIRFKPVVYKIVRTNESNSEWRADLTI